MLEPLHNFHVYQYWRWRYWLAEQQHQPFAQLHYYTCAELELYRGWRADYLRGVAI